MRWGAIEAKIIGDPSIAEAWPCRIMGIAALPRVARVLFVLRNLAGHALRTLMDILQLTGPGPADARLEVLIAPLQVTLARPGWHLTQLFMSRFNTQQ
jgi:hypothetical protein